jgi:two-component system, OmpR family, response regulator YxdJ
MQKIFIVEDDPQISSLLQSYLEKYSYQGVVVLNFNTLANRDSDKSHSM